MEAAQAHLSLHLLKCQIVGNHMSRLKYNIYYDKYAIMTIMVGAIYIVQNNENKSVSCNGYRYNALLVNKCI